MSLNRNLRPSGTFQAKQRGMALALLLWFLAALTLMVGSLMLVARTDIASASLHRESAQAAALGDGAALALLAGINARQVGHLRYQVDFAGQVLNVQAVPAVGLIGIYQADIDLLERLFSDLGGVPSQQAMELADSVVKWRDLRAETLARLRRRVPQSTSVEDLMSVSGMTREIFERIRPWIHAESSGGAPDPEWAPAQIRALLQAGQDEQEEQNFVAGTEQSVVDTLYKGTMRISSSVSFGGRRVYTRTVWVRPGGQMLMGWVILRREPVRVTTVNSQ